MLQLSGTYQIKTAPMPNSELADYIQQQLDANFTREQITTALLQQGWDDLSIEQAFADLLVKIDLPKQETLEITPAILNPQAVLQSSFASSVGSVATVAQPAVTIKKSPPVGTLITLSIAGLLLLGLAFATVHWGVPLFVLLKASRDFVNVDSVRAVIMLHDPDPNASPVRVETQLYADPELHSRVLVTGEYTDENWTTESYGVDVVFRNTDWYIKPSYSGMRTIEQELLQAAPMITTLPTYQTLRDIFYGDLWVYADLAPQDGDPAPPSLNLAHIDYFELVKQGALLVKINEYKKTTDARGRSVHLYTFGLRKAALVQFIDTKLRTIDSELTTADINQLLATIKSIDGWEENLITLTVDAQSGEIAHIDIRLPTSGGLVIPDSAPSAPTADANELDVQGVARSVLGSLLERPTSPLQPIASIAFDQYNQVPTITPPYQTISLETLAPELMRDWAPLFFGMMGEAMAEDTSYQQNK